MNIYCDRYSVCNSMLLDQGSVARNEAHARAKGWHLWNGFTLGGKRQSVILCYRCVESKRRELNPAPEHLNGQLDLFELVVRVGPEPKVPWAARAKEAWFRLRLGLGGV